MSAEEAQRIHDDTAAPAVEPQTAGPGEHEAFLQALFDDAPQWERYRPFDETTIAADETAVRILCPDAAVVRTSLIIGDGNSEHERVVHALAAKEREGALFTDDIRCPIHVADLASGLWKLAVSNEAGVFHLAGADALSRYSLGVLIARRDGISPSLLPAGRRADTRLPGALDVRIDSHATEDRLGIKLRGAREFLGER